MCIQQTIYIPLASDRTSLYERLLLHLDDKVSNDPTREQYTYMQVTITTHYMLTSYKDANYVAYCLTGKVLFILVS